MKIKDMGGEFALIDHLEKVFCTDHVDLIVGAGDDAAVIRIAPEPTPYLLVTTDILAEDSHFKSQWATAEQIGIKAAEVNLSDIAAMGGKPSWMFISLVLSDNMEAEWVRDLYMGIVGRCRRYGVVVAGGDTTRGKVNTINITLLGHVSQHELCLRSHARPGDILMVTGTLGASTAALGLLLQNKRPSTYLFEKHVTPSCRLDISASIARLANAMIDISDGLGSEVHHICLRSKTGAVIDAGSIPVHADVEAAAASLGVSPLEFALSGGEDFELLFSIDPEKLQELRETGIACYQVGWITEMSEGITLLTSDGAKMPLPGGYDHFS